MTNFKTITEDNFTDYIKHIVNKYDNIHTIVDKLCDVKYPNSKLYIKKEHALIYYEIYRKHDVKVKIDKDFDKNAYKKNKEIYDKTHS